MFGILVAVNPAEHSIVACLWAFKRLFRSGKCKIYILLVTGYTSEKYFVPLASCISSKVGQNRPGPALAEFLMQQLQQEYPQCKLGVDFEMAIETGCPVEKIRSFVLEREIRVLVMGEKHPLAKNGTKWSNTVFSCVRECPCISLVVRPTCFDIVQTEPLIEIFRHPQLEFDDFGWWSLFLGDTTSVEAKKCELPAPKVQEESKAVVNEPEAPQKTKKQFFGNLLKNANRAEEAPKQQSESKEKLSVQAREKSHFAGPVRKAQVFDEGNRENVQQKGSQEQERRPDTKQYNELERRQEEEPKQTAQDNERESSQSKEVERKPQNNEREYSQFKEQEVKPTYNEQEAELNQSEKNVSQNKDSSQKELEASGSEQLTPKSKWRSIHLDELNDKWIKSKEAKKAESMQKQSLDQTISEEKANFNENQESEAKEIANSPQPEFTNETLPSSSEPSSSQAAEAEKKQKKSFFQKLLTKERTEPTSPRADSTSTEAMKEMEKQHFAGPSRQK